MGIGTAARARDAKEETIPDDTGTGSRGMEREDDSPDRATNMGARRTVEVMAHPECVEAAVELRVRGTA